MVCEYETILFCILLCSKLLQLYYIIIIMYNYYNSIINLLYSCTVYVSEYSTLSTNRCVIIVSTSLLLLGVWFGLVSLSLTHF